MDKKHKRTFALGICIAIFVGIIIANFAGSFVSSLLAGIVAVLVPLTACLIVVFICKHVMDFLETKVLNRIFKKPHSKAMRITSLILSFLFLVAIIVLVCLMFIPRTVSVIGELVSNREVYEKQLTDEVTGILASIFGNSADDMVASITATVTQWIQDAFRSVLPQVATIGSSVLGVLGNILLGIVVGLLYLFDRENVNHYVGRMARVRMGKEKVEKTKYFLEKSDRILIDFLVAKVIECIVITVCVGITLTIIGVEASFELAFIVGVLNVIPYVGFFIAIVPMALISLVYGSVQQLIYALIAVTIVYNVITTFVTPFIVGSKVKMNMIVMFISMIIGGCLFGMFGMMIGIPAGAVISEFIKEDVENRENKMNIKNNDVKEQQVQEVNNPEIAKLLNSSKEQSTGNVQEEQNIEKTTDKKAKKKKIELDIQEENSAEIALESENDKLNDTKTKKSVKKVEKEQQIIEDSKISNENKKSTKKTEKTKKDNKIKQLFSKMKYNFSNISPEEETDK